MRLALNSKNKFDEYIFIEKRKDFAQELQEIIDTEYSTLKNTITIKNEDCNVELERLCKSIDWQKNRAILFLDPYATEVKWETLEIIASTKAIDLWYLFPFSAARRLMKRDGKMDNTWVEKLNSIFGNSEWRDKFYIQNPQISFSDDDNNMIKNVNAQALSEYIVTRLKSLFPAVANNPRFLYNTKNNPLFLFCFAVANPAPQAYGLALKFAKHILDKHEM